MTILAGSLCVAHTQKAPQGCGVFQPGRVPISGSKSEEGEECVLPASVSEGSSLHLEFLGRVGDSAL